MPDSHFTVGVIVAKKALRANPWKDYVWLPYAVLPSAPAVAAGTTLGRVDAAELIYAGAFDLCLERSATSHYRDNLAAARPSVWVALHESGEDFGIGSVTADPYEGEALTEGIGITVEAVAMPEALQAAIWAFVEAFHVERKFVKRKRDRAATERGRHPAREAMLHGR